MKVLARSAAFLALLATAACGGGGSSAPTSSVVPAVVASGASTASPTTTTSATATPTVAPTPGVANTSLQSYLPFHAGNHWTFASGGNIVDGGPETIACSCTVNGYPIERMDLYASSGTYIQSWIFAKGNWPLSPFTGDRITYLVGTSATQTGPIAWAFYNFAGTIPGVPSIDDTPQAGEQFSLTTAIGSANVTTTITSVAGTQPFGSQVINNVAVSNLAGNGYTITLGFAQGVGFTGFSASVGGQTIAASTLTSFSLSSLSTSSVERSTNNYMLRVSGDTSTAVADLRSSLLSISGVF